jgi:phospho-N-acetylmuramoyl-pentapeptide-transferase
MISDWISSPLIRILMAAATSFILSIGLGPWFIKKLYQLKIGQPIRTDECPLLGKLHHDKKDTPTMGGILVIFSLLVSVLLWGKGSSSYLWVLTLATLAFAFLGGRDDFLKLKYKKNSKGLSSKKKLLVQGLVASLFALYLLVPEVTGWLGKAPIIQSGGLSLSLQEFAGHIYLPFVKTPWLIFSGLGLIALFFWVLFVIVGASNAVNLTDGLDGLAGGLLLLSAIVFGIIAYLSSSQLLASYFQIPYIDQASEVALFLASMGGALLGFLWYNGYPAQLFMGDIGSLTLGGVIGMSALLLGRGFLLGLVGGIFVIEALSVILQVISFRYFDKKRIFLCAPLHHHYEYQGLKETKVVMRFWIVGFLLACLGLLTLVI